MYEKYKKMLSGFEDGLKWYEELDREVVYFGEQ